MKKQIHVTALVLGSLLSYGFVNTVQAADVPLVSTGGVAYNIGLQGEGTFDNSDNVYLGGQAGARNSNPYAHSGDPNARGNNIAIGRISMNGANGGGNVALGAKTFLEGKGDYNFLGNFAAGYKSTLSDTIAIGYFAGAGSTGNKNVWLGNSQGSGSQASNTVLIGSNSSVQGNFNYGIGHGLILQGEKNSALGAYNKIEGNQSGAFGVGTYNVAAVHGDGSYSIGNQNHINADNSFVLGNNVTTSLNNAVVLGNGSTATSNDVVGTPSYQYQSGQVVKYAGSNPVSTVSVGASNQERTITHVAAGRVTADSTDAVNGSQLFGANRAIDSLNDKIKDVESASNRGDAQAAAIAALHPLQFDPDHRLQVMGGLGHYKGENALALGVGYYPRENLLLTLGTSINKDIMANVGVSYKFGKNKYPYGNSFAAYESLEKRVASLEAQNQELRDLVKTLIKNK